MSTPVWPFTENPFDNGTKGSRKKMNIISSDHNSKLHALISNPLIATLYAFFNPVRIAFLQKYVQWMSTQAAYSSATLAVQQLLAQLSGDKIEEFDIRIQNVYRRGTTQYQALLPHFREPFQQGEYDEKIAALKALSENMGVDPALAPIKVDVDAFYLLLETARDFQQGKELLLGTISDELEQQRIVTAQAMYYTLGGLMQLYNSSTETIADFFDLETLRGHVSDTVDLIFDGSINGNSVVNVLNPAIVQYIPGLQLRIKNTTPGSSLAGFYFYTADNPNESWNGNGQHISPGQEITVTIVAAQFRPYFNVHNQGATLQSYEVEIVEA